MSANRAQLLQTSRNGRASPLFVNSVEKALRVLRAFGAGRRTMGLAEIVEATGLDKSSAQRFAHTLHALELLRKDAVTKRFSLSAKVLDLGFTYLRTDSLVETAAPFLREANEQVGETINLTELDGTEVIYVARYPSRHAVSVDVTIGTRLPAYCTAPGRIMLAFLPEDDAEAVLKESKRVPLTRHTVTGMARVRHLIREAREHGFAIADQECFIGDISVAAPVLDDSGQAIAAVNIAVPVSRWSLAETRRRFAPVVRNVAGAISRTHAPR